VLVFTPYSTSMSVAVSRSVHTTWPFTTGYDGGEP
jgi:hypothetical protein